MSSVLFSTNPLEWRLTDAVVIDEQDQPSAPELVSAPRVVHMIGEFPWGPPNELVEISSQKALQETFFGNTENGRQYGGYVALNGKQWARLEIVRVVNPSDTHAKLELKNDADSNVVVIQAKYPGAAGNEIKARLHNVKGDDYELHVSWGAALEIFKIKHADGVAPVVNSKLISIVENESKTTLSSGWTISTKSDFKNLTGGTTNQITNEVDWTGSATQLKGLRVARGGSDGGVWLAANHTGEAWLASLREAVAAKRGVGVVQAKGSEIKDQINFAKTTADDRIFFYGPLVTQYVDGELMTVETAPFAASVLVLTSPNLSPAEDRWTKYLYSIQGIANNQELTREVWIDADDAGLNLLEKRETGGFRFHMGITSDPSNSKQSIVRRRMTDFINNNIAAALAPFRNKAQIPEHRLSAKLAMKGRLELMKGIEASADSQMIESYLVEEVKRDPTSIDYSVKVRLPGEMRYLIAHVMVGENVTIEEKK